MDSFCSLIDVVRIGDKVAYYVDDKKIITTAMRIEKENNLIETVSDEGKDVLFDRRYTRKVTECVNKKTNEHYSIVRLLKNVETRGRDEEDCWVIAPQFNISGTFQQLQM